jgi:hypothetical protein
MWKYLAFLPLLFIGQQGMAPGPGMPAAAAGGGGGCPFTDSFSGFGALSPSWSTPGAPFLFNGTMNQYSGFASGVSGGQGAALVTGSTCSFSEDQYAQATINSPVEDWVVALYVLASSSGNGYVLWMDYTWQVEIWRLDAGVVKVLVNCGNVEVDGDTYKLVVTGTGSGQTITAYHNGTAIPGCSVVDHTYTSGYPGMSLGGSSQQFMNFSAD